MRENFSNFLGKKFWENMGKPLPLLTLSEITEISKNFPQIIQSYLLFTTVKEFSIYAPLGINFAYYITNLSLKGGN